MVGHRSVPWLCAVISVTPFLSEHGRGPRSPTGKPHDEDALAEDAAPVPDDRASPHQGAGDRSSRPTRTGHGSAGLLSQPTPARSLAGGRPREPAEALPVQGR